MLAKTKTEASIAPVNSGKSLQFNVSLLASTIKDSELHFAAGVQLRNEITTRALKIRFCTINRL